MAIANRRLRDLQRLAHLGGAAAVGSYLYGPWTNAPLFTSILQWGVFPDLTRSGTLLWQGPRLRRALRSRVGADARHTPATQQRRQRRRESTNQLTRRADGRRMDERRFRWQPRSRPPDRSRGRRPPACAGAG